MNVDGKSNSLVSGNQVDGKDSILTGILNPPKPGK